MGTTHALEQPMKRALSNIRSLTGVSLAFGGVVDSDGSVTLQSFAGPIHGPLAGVRLAPGEGLGGKVAAIQRGVTVNDYFESRYITHRYDQVIAAEGLRSLVAVPVIVGRKVVATLYGATRNGEIIGGRIEQTVQAEVRVLEQSVAIQNSITEKDYPDGSARLRAQLSSIFAEVRALAVRTAEPETRRTLTALADRLSAARADDRKADAVEAEPRSTLTVRERDVLALAAAGLSNGAIAESLGLTLYTVKSYMKSVMAKLGGRTRFEAVVAARASGFLP